MKGASFFGIGQGTARGGVPSARIAAYKVCYPSGCDTQKILAAFDDAIADGVDIITISLGATSATPLANDEIGIGAFHAMAKGILTVNSAGNSGPEAGFTSSIAPWLMSVAASTIDPSFVDNVVLGNGKTVAVCISLLYFSKCILYSNDLVTPTGPFNKFLHYERKKVSSGIWKRSFEFKLLHFRFCSVGSY